MINRESMRTLREITQIAKKNPDELSKVYQSYTTLYNLVRSGRVPVTKLGNRYLLRIIDIENFLAGNIAPVVDGIRRIE